jgi:hypothetical protein
MASRMVASVTRNRWLRRASASATSAGRSHAHKVERGTAKPSRAVIFSCRVSGNRSLYLLTVALGSAITRGHAASGIGAVTISTSGGGGSSTTSAVATPSPMGADTTLRGCGSQFHLSRGTEWMDWAVRLLDNAAVHTATSNRERPKSNIAEARDKVHRHVKDLLRVVDREEPLSATHVETVLWSGVLRLGGAMMALFFARQAARWPAGTQYELRGLTYEVEGGETVEVGTKFAKIAIWRPVGRVRLPRDLPMTRALGLPGNFTLPLITLVARFAAMMAFLPTRQILRDLLGWAPAPRSVLRMVDAIAQERRRLPATQLVRTGQRPDERHEARSAHPGGDVGRETGSRDRSAICAAPVVKPVLGDVRSHLGDLDDLVPKRVGARGLGQSCPAAAAGLGEVFDGGRHLRQTKGRLAVL